MIDIRLVRAEPEVVKAALARKGVDAAEVDAVLALDAEFREANQRQEQVRARVKELSKLVGVARREGDVDRSEALSSESRGLGDQQQELARQATEIEGRLRSALLVLPNLPAESAAEGKSDDDNPILVSGGPGADSYEAHQRVPHWDIGAELRLLDMERAAKLSGSMFPLYRGDGALLSRALLQLYIDRATDDGTWEEIRPPTLVRTEAITASGHLPKFADEAYQLERDDLWAIPTAEVPLTSLRRDEILSEAELPLKMCAYTPCYRREAGSAGKDTRGLLRVHEFDKVELMAYTTPNGAAEVFQEIRRRAEELCRDLGFTYRVLEICAGALGQSHAQSFDLEIYAPGCEQWLEVSSVSWYSDYQARRANVRYRPEGGGTPAFVHTTNGSALAIPRVWAALVEANRQPDGFIAVPEVLQPYTKKSVLGRGEGLRADAQ
ncbi:MAG TPA: serine--tRNA ligase [Acidimicrobiales bacterium]|nr:serine--tRNA ligase [Acidimicrobiales bacterium]